MIFDVFVKQVRLPLILEVSAAPYLYNTERGSAVAHNICTQHDVESTLVQFSQVSILIDVVAEPVPHSHSGDDVQWRILRSVIKCNCENPPVDIDQRC